MSTNSIFDPSPPEKLQLVEDLWEDLAATPSEVPIQDWQKEELARRKDRIHKFGHMHLDDLLERRDRFANELIVAGHFSTRYHPRQIRYHVEKALPDMLGGRLHLWI